MNVKPRIPPTYGSSWEPRNLAAIEERPKIVPDLGGLGLVYPGKRHVFSGPPESAKTIAAYIVALEVVRQGGIVLLVDFEMGQWDARDRLRELGATDVELASVLYVEPEEPATEKVVAELIERHKPSLVIIDAAAGAFDLQGLDDNKRADVERFASVYVRAFFLRGIATIVLDHVVKKPGDRGAFVIGSERKVGGADVHLGFEAAGKKLHRGGRGFYRIATHKDRLGHLPRPIAAKLELASDPETHAISWQLLEADGTEVEGGFRPTELMERVSRYLEMQSEPMSRSAITRDVSGRRECLLVAVDRLLEEGYASQDAGPRGARLVESLRSYRQADDTAPIPTRSSPVPGMGPDDPFPVPTPYGGERDGDGSGNRPLSAHPFPRVERGDDIPF